VLLSRVAGFIKDPVGLVAGQALIPKVNGQAGQLAQIGRKGLITSSLWAEFTGQMHWITHHNAHHPKAAAEPRQRAQIHTAATAPFQSKHGLRRQAQLIGHSYANATVADVQTEIAGLVQLPAPGFQLPA